MCQCVDVFVCVSYTVRQSVSQSVHGIWICWVIFKYLSIINEGVKLTKFVFNFQRFVVVVVSATAFVVVVAHSSDSKLGYYIFQFILT